MADINPKAVAGRKKIRAQFTPVTVLNEIHKGMTEGAEKYGPYNWRETDIEAGDYYDSTMRHMSAWWDGEDIDPDSGVHHVSKAITGLIVLRDAMLHGTCIDDRSNHPPSARAKVIKEKFSDHGHGRKSLTGINPGKYDGGGERQATPLVKYHPDRNGRKLTMRYGREVYACYGHVSTHAHPKHCDGKNHD